MSDTKTECSQNRMPPAAKLLGYGGLIPFIGLAFGAITLQSEQAEIASRGLLLYAAIILSFLGGLHWGRIAASAEMTDKKLSTSDATAWLVWSVIPSLWGWGVIWILSDYTFQALLLALGLFVCWQVDRFAITAGLFENWLRRLRRNLSIVAILALVITALI